MSISTAVQQSAIARVVGIKTEFVDLRGGRVVLLPQRVVILAQGSSNAVYSTDKKQISSALEAGQIYGFGSPIHLIASEVLPVSGDGVGTIPVTVYPLEDAGGAVASAGDITPSGAVTKAGAFNVVINEVVSESFVVALGDSVAAITAKVAAAISAALEMPMIPTDNGTDVGLLAKWAGTSSNDLKVSVEGPTDTGVSFAITQPVGGLVNPDVDPALAQMGNVWETLIINGMEQGDTSTLDKLATVGEGRWGALVRRPFVAFNGSTETDVDTISTVPEARKTDRTNVTLAAPGSDELPFVVAARMVARIAVVANDNPASDYGSQQATGLVPGSDADQWNYIQRDTLVKRGVSTSEVKSGVINLSDTVTYYHPDGDILPAYRFVKNIIKLQNIIFNLDLIFAVPSWDGAPLIPDGQPTTNRTAKKPSMAVAAVNSVIDGLGLEAILSDPESAKASTVAGINETNPDRLDVSTTVQLSGNTNIISVDLDFGFFFGTAPIVA